MVDHHLNVLDQLAVAPHHHVSSADTAVMILVDHVVGHHVEETTTIDATEVKSHTVDPTQVAQSVPQQVAVLTVAVAVATQTVTVTTVMKNVATDQEYPPQTQTMRGVTVVDLTGDITPPHLQRKTRVRVHAHTAAGNIIGGDTNGAVVAALVEVVGVAVPVPTVAAATVAAVALPVVHLSPPRALHIDMVTAGDLTAQHADGISTDRESTVPSLLDPLPAHKPETATPHRHKELEVVEVPQRRVEVLQNIEIHSQLDNSWKKSNLEKEGMNLVLALRQASRSRTLHRDTLGPSSPLPLETKVCCLFLASSKQERSHHYFLLHVQLRAKSLNKGKILIVTK